MKKLMLIKSAAVSGSAAVIDVPATHPTIQAAVDAAGSGDEIKIAAGVYREQVVITNKNLTLTGSPGAVLRAVPGMRLSLEAFGSTRVPLLGIAVADVAVSGLTLEGERLGESQPNQLEGIYFFSASGRVENCRIMGFRSSTLGSLDADGVLVVNAVSSGTGVVNVEVIGSTFADNSSSITLIGDLPRSEQSTFDSTLLRTTFAVNDNTIAGNGPEAGGRQSGIYIWAGASGEVKRNTVTDHSYSGTTDPIPYSFGIVALDEKNFQLAAPLEALKPIHFEGNVFRNNQLGLALIRGDGSTIVNNSFQGRAPGIRPGGLYLSGENVWVATNRFDDLETGILLFGNDPDFGTSLGIASNATLIANGFCNVDTYYTFEPPATYVRQGTLTCTDPMITIQAVLLSWPFSYTGYSVETATNPNGPWTLSDATVFPIKEKNSVILPMDGDPRFFRLHRP